MQINRVANFINHNKTAQKLLKSVNDNPALYGALATGIFTLCLRPATIEAMPFKEKKDKQYSIASSIAAGAIELLGSCLLFVPLKNVLKTASDNLYKVKGTVYHNNPEVLRQFKSISSRGVKIVFLTPLALARFSLVKPIVNTLFGKKDSIKQNPVRSSISFKHIQTVDEFVRGASHGNK